MKHYLLNSAEARWELCFKFIDAKKRDIWNFEDRPKLEPFFNWSSSKRNIQMSAEEVESFDFYQKCLDYYGRERADLRNSVSHFSEETIIGVFGYEYV